MFNDTFSNLEDVVSYNSDEKNKLISIALKTCDNGVLVLKWQVGKGEKNFANPFRLPKIPLDFKAEIYRPNPDYKLPVFLSNQSKNFVDEINSHYDNISEIVKETPYSLRIGKILFGIGLDEFGHILEKWFLNMRLRSEKNIMFTPKSKRIKERFRPYFIQRKY